MSHLHIERRPATRHAYCRGCDEVIKPGEDMITTYSHRNRGQHIHFCLECGRIIGELANQ